MVYWAPPSLVISIYKIFLLRQEMGESSQDFRSHSASWNLSVDLESHLELSALQPRKLFSYSLPTFKYESWMQRIGLFKFLGSWHTLITGTLSFFFFFCLFRATLVAYGSSQARAWIGVTTAGLHHSHSNARSEPHLWPIPQLTATLDP